MSPNLYLLASAVSARITFNNRFFIGTWFHKEYYSLLNITKLGNSVSDYNQAESSVYPGIKAYGVKTTERLFSACIVLYCIYCSVLHLLY